jgi:hypothetical protein
MKITLLLMVAFALVAATGCNQSNSTDANPAPDTNTAVQNAEAGASNAWQDTKSGATNVWNKTTNAINGRSTN